MPAFTRRQLFRTLTLGGLGSVCYARLIEPDWFEVTRQEVHLGKGRMTRPIRIAQMSDMHASDEVPLSRIARAFSLATAEKPDIVCLTGDYVTNSHGYDIEEYGRIMRQLASAVPTYAVFGNHDGGGWAVTQNSHSTTEILTGMLTSAGVKLIENQSTLVTIRDQPLRLVGVGDLWNLNVRPERAFAGLASGRTEPTVLLAHNPDTKDEVSEYPWDLMLSGHTHGGQVALPIIGPPHVPVEDTRYVAGLKPWGDRQIYVTRGVGTLLRVRFNCRPEVTILDLMA